MARIWNTLHAIGPFQFHRISRSVGGSQLGYLLLLFSWLPFLKLNDYFHKRVRYHSVIVELVTIELNIFFLITIISVHFYFFINFTRPTWNHQFYTFSLRVQAVLWPREVLVVWVPIEIWIDLFGLRLKFRLTNYGIIACFYEIK